MIDPFLVISVVSGISLIVGLYNSYILWRTGRLNRDDVLLLMKVIATFVPQIQSPIIRQIFNELTHAILERMKLVDRSPDIDKILERIRQIAEQQAQRR